MSKFLDRYTADQGDALIASLEAGRGTKETLRFLCWSAAQALKVAKAQHEAAESGGAS